MPPRHSIVPATDEELIESFIQSGNIELAGDLFERYMQLVYGVCLKYLRDREPAKEMVMKIFEKLVAELPSTQINCFKPWLYVVTKNCCLMELRSRKSTKAREQIWAESVTQNMENDGSLHPLNDYDNQVLTDALHDCIGRLNDHQRQCIELFYFQELSYLQIAESTTIDINKVKSYIQNGKRNLKLCMDQKAL